MTGIAKPRVVCGVAFVVLVFACPLAAQDVSRELDGHVVLPGSRVSLAYTLRLEDGSLLDRTEPGQPVVFEQGDARVIPGLNDAILGMKLAERKQVVIPPEKAYGPKDPLALRPIPLSQLPEGAGVPGTEMGTEDEEGRPVLMRVERVEGDMAIVDFNHPLAGKTLYFDIEVVAID